MRPPGHALRSLSPGRSSGAFEVPQTRETPKVVTLLAALLVLVTVATAGCRPSDPRDEVLKQRSRWTADLLSWVPGDDDTISLTVRLSGPPNSTLSDLTFRVSLLDSDNRTLSEIWQTTDLSDVARGGPKDKFFKIAAAGMAVEGLAVSLVLDPTPEQELHIKELRELRELRELSEP